MQRCSYLGMANLQTVLGWSSCLGRIPFSICAHRTVRMSHVLRTNSSFKSQVAFSLSLPLLNSLFAVYLRRAAGTDVHTSLPGFRQAMILDILSTLDHVLFCNLERATRGL